MKVIKNYLYNASYQLLSIIVPLITTPYINRVLGPHGVGINTFTNTIVQYFILFGSIGIGLYGNREIAYVRDDVNNLSKLFWEVQSIKFIGIFLSSVLYFTYIGFSIEYKSYLIAQYFNLMAAAIDISWLFQGLENFKVTVIRNTIVKFMSVVLVFTLIKDDSDVITYICILGISTLIGNFTLWPYLTKIIIRVKLRELSLKRHIKPSVYLFIPQVALQVYQVLNKTILGIFVGTNYSGYFYNADTTIKMFLSLITSIGTVMLPHAAHAFAQGKREELDKLMYTSANITTFITVAFMFGIASVSLKLAPIFFGSQFSIVGKAMIVEVPVIYFAGISGVLGTQYMLPTNQISEYSRSLILGAILSIVLDLLLIPMFSLMGAMLASVFAEFGVMAYQLYVVMIKEKSLDHIKFFKDSEKYFLAGSLMFIATEILDKKTPNTILSLACEVIVGACIYLTIICLLKPLAYKIIREKILGNFN